MTPQEAVKLIKELYYEEDYCLVPELAEALDLAIKALEKQIPKKQTPDMRCPNCGHSVYNDSYKFCMKCGQVIDWSDTE